jgi:hypothetical protein
MITKFEAMVSLRPGCGFELHEDGSINWWNTSSTCPTETELNAEIIRLQVIEDANAYKAKRAAEYPPMTDYLDGIVKGDNAQVQAYIDACNAVKNKYPKGAA